jgi:precorrin-2 dehydrogenase/sirohydrochlorin ferrochelatase
VDSTSLIPSRSASPSRPSRIVPEVLPPAFFPVGLNLAGRKCVVLGAADDREASEKCAALRECGALVVWISDYAALRDEDVSDAYLVVLTPADDVLAARLRGLAERFKFLFCAIDQPKYGFVAMVATVKSGRARIAISTGGASPRVGAQLRAKLQTALDETFARFLECLANQRRRARANSASSQERRAIMRKATDGFDVEVRLTYPDWFLDELRRLGPSAIEP